ncbi:MAG: type II toxin-antitoxin system VapC family toxin [Verrucomicrobiales bacterium]|nr:type II toxin-antitoxin system VapC family toxin [Verrucomicrobiales bacterium]
MIVVDNTVLIDFWAGEEPFRSDAKRLFRMDSDWIAPGLWFYEFGNVMSKLARLNVISESRKKQAWSDALEMVRSFHEIDAYGVDRLAESKGLKFYDAAYVWLAQSQECVLHTRDKQILRECSDVAVAMPL